MIENDKNVLFGGPLNTEIDTTISVGQLMLKRLELHPDKVALINAITSEKITYGEIRAKGIELAKCFTAIGLNKGDAIGICSENRMEFAPIYVAAFSLGMIIAPMNNTYTETELYHAFNISKPKIMFASANVTSKVMKVSQQCKYMKRIIQLGEEKTTIKGVTLFNTFIKQYLRPKQQFQTVSLNVHEDVALILCSSGTTGIAKGVQLTHVNVLSVIYSTIERMELMKMILEDITIMSVVPWFHSYGCMILISLVTSNAKFVYMPRFDEVRFLSSIQEYKVSILNLVPPIMVFLAKHPLVSKYDLSSVFLIGCGAAPLSKEIADAVKERIGVSEIRQAYGLSETTLGVLAQSGDEHKPGSVGILAPGMWGKIVDPDNGNSLGPNQRGELCFKGPLIMKGYIGNDEATRDALDKDGWLHTGDIGYYDEDKHWFIVDRLKELIKYKGFQVPPAELEAILLTNNKIKDAACVGLPDEACGELPLAFVVKQPNADITENEIIKYVDERISSAKRLRGGVRFINEIPKNPSGKLLRRELKALLVKQKSKL